MVLLILLSIGLISAVIFFSPKTINLGTGDFRSYWSSSYLLAHGQDFSNLVLMDQVERGLTGWEKSFTMMAWFAPTGMVVLLLLVLLPFDKAAFIRLLINITILSATTLLWKNTIKEYWVPFLAIFGFPMTLLSLYVGQVNTLVLFGLTLYLSLEKNSINICAV